MRLTTFTDYSIRVLIYAATKKDELTSIREVSEVYDISSNHLMKVVHRLGQGGFLHTVRGKKGGFRLAKDPKDINLGDVIRYTEDDLNIVDCLKVSDCHGKNAHECRLANDCHFGRVMTEALAAFLGVVNKYTLADLIENFELITFARKA